MITLLFKGPKSGSQPLALIAGVIGEKAAGSASGWVMAQSVKKSAIILSMRVVINSLMLNQSRNSAASPAQSAPPANAASSKSGIITTAGRSTANPTIVAKSAPITNCPGCPKLTGPAAKATDADNPVRINGTALFNVVANGYNPKSEKLKSAP